MTVTPKTRPMPSSGADVLRRESVRSRPPAYYNVVNSYIEISGSLIQVKRLTGGQCIRIWSTGRTTKRF